MFPGFFIGSVFLFMLVRSLFHGPRMGFYRPGYRHWSWGSHDATAPFSGVAPRDQLDAAVRRFVASLRERLHATPAQEKTLARAVSRLRDASAAIKSRTSEARDHLARAVAGDAFEPTAFDAAYRRVDLAMQELRSAARDAFADVHDALDRSQREILASMIESTRSADIALF